jgi:hypothetical protein
MLALPQRPPTAHIEPRGCGRTFPLAASRALSPQTSLPPPLGPTHSPIPDAIGAHLPNPRHLSSRLPRAHHHPPAHHLRHPNPCSILLPVGRFQARSRLQPEGPYEWDKRIRETCGKLWYARTVGNSQTKTCGKLWYARTVGNSQTKTCGKLRYARTVAPPSPRWWTDQHLRSVPVPEARSTKLKPCGQLRHSWMIGWSTSADSKICD